jgi:hypothetical protein
VRPRAHPTNGLATAGAMVITARDKGQIEYADRLAKQALDVLDSAMATEVARQRHLKK